MFEINHRKKMGIKLKDNFFADDVQAGDKQCDAVYYLHCKTPQKHSQEFKTLIIDLTQTEDEIYEGFKRTNKQSVKRMIKEPLVNFIMIEDPQDEDVEEFIRHFNEFAESKGIYKANRELLYNLKNVGKLRIAKALFVKEDLCLFAYISDGERVLSKYECNLRFSDMDNKDKVRLIGHSNKMLEFFCMKWFKEHGSKVYDMCGLTFNEDDEQSSNIDKRKLGFGGEVITEYHFIHPVTFKGRVFEMYKRLSGTKL